MSIAQEDFQGSCSRYNPQNYPQLQNLLRKNPALYEDEYLTQYAHFNSLLSLFELSPSEESDALVHLCELITFLSHTSYCYPHHAKGELFKKCFLFLKNNPYLIHPSLRKSLVQNLILLRHKGQVDSVTDLYSLLFQLLACHDKPLRTMVYTFLVTDIKAANTPHKNERLNRILQSYLMKLWSDLPETTPAQNEESLSSPEIMGKLALRLTLELYHKQVWDDIRTVNYVAQACLQANSKIYVPALHFFIGHRSFKARLDEAGDCDGEEEFLLGSGQRSEHVPDVGRLKHAVHVAGSSKAKEAKVKRAMASVKRHEKKLNGETLSSSQPIALLHDPQGFAEKLFQKLKSSTESYETRLLLIHVISRLIGYHKLILLPLYSFLTKYIRPSQKNVTHVLVYTAQATHEYVSHEDLDGVVKTIIQYFVADYCSPEVITVGLNSLREICARSPSALDATTLAYCVQFKSFKNKGVVMAARSFIALYREKQPELLPKKERGKEASMKLKEGREGSGGGGRGGDGVCGGSGGRDEKLHAEDDDALEDGDTWKDEDNSGDSEEEGSQPTLSSEEDLEEGADDESKDENQEDGSEQEGSSEFVSLRSIQSFSKRKNTYEERLASIKAGRDTKEKYKHKKKKLETGGGMSNAEKKKSKNFMMLKHKRGGRLSRTRLPFSKQQAVLKKQQGQKRRK